MSGNDVHKMEDFVAGDDRAMSQPTLLSTHVVWLREHNRIAKYLKPYLKSKDQQGQDDILFQVRIIAFQKWIYFLIIFDGKNQNHVHILRYLTFRQQEVL